MPHAQHLVRIPYEFARYRFLRLKDREPVEYLARFVRVGGYAAIQPDVYAFVGARFVDRINVSQAETAHKSRRRHTQMLDRITGPECPPN